MLCCRGFADFFFISTSDVILGEVHGISWLAVERAARDALVDGLRCDGGGGGESFDDEVLAVVVALALLRGALVEVGDELVRLLAGLW